jgi:hypothetical protein
VIPLNQLIPECLLALGAAFMLGNLAAYIRLRPAWREAKRAGAGQGERQGGKKAANDASTSRRGAGATRAGTARTVAAGSGASKTRVAKAVDAKPSGSSAAVRKPKGAAASGAKLPSRTRVLANVVIGLVISVAALATLLRG